MPSLGYISGLRMIGLINAVTMLFTLGAWAFVANLLAKREEAAELARMRREVLRESEYKEVIFV